MKNRYNESDSFDNYTDYDDGFTTSTAKKYGRNIYSDSKRKHSADDLIYSDSSLVGNSQYSDSDFENSKDFGRKPKGKGRIKKILLSLLSILLVLALLACGLAFIFLGRITNKVNFEEIDEAYSRQNVLSEDVNLSESSSVKNILICVCFHAKYHSFSTFSAMELVPSIQTRSPLCITMFTSGWARGRFSLCEPSTMQS